MHKEIAKDLFSFLEKSPTAFHAIDTIRAELEENGYQELPEEMSWKRGRAA